MTRLNRWLCVVAVSIALIILSTHVGHAEQPATQAGNPVIHGVVRVADQIMLPAKEPGVLVQLAVKEGTQVKAGQVIGKIDDSDVVGALAASTFVGASTSPQTRGGAAGDLPYVVKFETGAKSFLKGDVITITEVRGTADTIERGNIYCVKGTYKLASREKATLAAYTTVSKASDDGGPSLRVQHANVDRGKGAFTLYLPMYVDGCPHVSFYSETQSIGGVYFGTGKSLYEDRSATGAQTDTSESLREELNRLESRIKVLEQKTH